MSLEFSITWGVPSHVLYSTLLNELYSNKRDVQGHSRKGSRQA